MFKTLDDLLSMDHTNQHVRRGLFIRWAGGIVIAAVQFQALYTALSALD